MNITYLLGAGASYNALPVIDELPSRLNVFATHVKEAKSFLSAVNNKPDFVREEDMQSLLNAIYWLLEEMKTHKTVDTLAKKYYVLSNREPDLIVLKKTLIAYFLFEQRVQTAQLGNVELKTSRYKEIPDKRYDSFIATIISKERGNLTLDPSFKIVTWNYDSQFELAYRSYSEKNDFKFIQQKLQVMPSFITQESRYKFNQNKFGLVRLNGVAGFLSSDVFDNLVHITNHAEVKVHLLGAIAYKFANMLEEEMSVFNYSWESKEQFESVHSEKQTLVEIAHQIMRETNILVVIGYSFPNFNRSVDKLLLQDLRNLQKVYVQDVNAEEVCELIRSSFELKEWHVQVIDDVRYDSKSEQQVPVIPVKGVDQFFIPPEADI
jgi:hypothetical protein